MLHRISPILLCLLTVLAFSSAAVAQQTGDDANAQDPETVALQKEIAKEKLRTELAAQQRKTLDAKLPHFSDDAANKTLKGEIKVEDKEKSFETESTALSYEALSVIARQVSRRLQSRMSDFTQLVIYNDNDFRGLVQYRLFESQAMPALEAYHSLLDPEQARGANGLSRGIGPEILGLPEMGTAFVKSAIDFISLFRTDTTISNKPVQIEESALGALVANDLVSAHPNYKVYFPAAYIPEHDWIPENENAVLTQLTKLYAYNAVVKEILASYNATAPAEKPKHLYHAKIPAFTALNTQVDRLLSNYEDEKGESSTNRLRTLIRAEQLTQMLDDPKTGILQLKVLNAGGSERISRNLIFGSKIRHSGGVVAEYLLFDQAGALRSSDTLYFHTGFQKMENIKQVNLDAR